jgi:Spy/CpxP family protein refolding chaperone
VGKKNQNQDIHSRLRELTEQTRRTRRELEDLIHRPEGDRVRSFSHERNQFFRRRRNRPAKI